MSDRTEPADGSAPADGTDRTARIEALRPTYHSYLTEGTDRFFDPRRSSCPWCGSDAPTTRLRTTDLLQHKLGPFTLDRADCGHTFQNPRLHEAGP
ncbi:hypothetical protein [Streptomyces sp. NPDC002758]